MCHMSHVMCHVSHVKRDFFIIIFFYKVMKLVGGGSVINGPNLSSFLLPQDQSKLTHQSLQRQHIGSDPGKMCLFKRTKKIKKKKIGSPPLFGDASI